MNEAGEAVSVATISPEEEETPPPRPPEPEKFSRSISPSSSSTTNGRELGPETVALRTLAAHKRYIRPLPDLLPFPFKADEPVYRKKNNTKVPKPSKFTKGEMYHSDYESDFEGTIGVKWRAAQSDTEDSEFGYKRVSPKLKRGFIKKTLEEKHHHPVRTSGKVMKILKNLKMS